MKKSLFYLEGGVALAYDAFAQMFSSPPLPQELVRLPTYDYRKDSITKSSTHASLMEITSAEDNLRTTSPAAGLSQAQVVLRE